MKPNGVRSAWPQVFILSPGRSGSTLLRLILDAHPKICCPGELNLGQLCEDLYRAVYYSVGQARSSNETERDELAAKEVNRIVNDLLTSYARLKGKLIWAEKTPKNLEYLKTLKKVFPDAAYICLYRHLMDVAHSAIEANKYGKNNYELWNYSQLLEYCINQTADLMAFERENNHQCFRVKYETLVSDPASVLQDLFSFLGVEWDNSLLDGIFNTPHDAGPGDPKAFFSKRIHTDSIGKGSQLELKSSLPSAVLTRMNQLLTALGYPESGPDWSRSAGVLSTAAVIRSCAQHLSGVNEVFNTYLPKRLSQDMDTVKAIRGTVKFIVKGTDGGIWRIDLSKSPALIDAGDGDTDCTIMVNSSDLIKIANGEVNAGECFLQARIKIAGNESLAFRVGQALFN